MPFPGSQGGLPFPPMTLPATRGGAMNSVGNPDLNALAGKDPSRSPLSAAAGGDEAVLKFAYEAENAVDKWIAAIPEDDEAGENSDTSSIRSELADIKAKLHELALRAVPDKRGPSVDLSGPVGPAGEGKSRF